MAAYFAAPIGTLGAALIALGSLRPVPVATGLDRTPISAPSRHRRRHAHCAGMGARPVPYELRHSGYGVLDVAY